MKMEPKARELLEEALADYIDTSRALIARATFHGRYDLLPHLRHAIQLAGDLADQDIDQASKDLGAIQFVATVANELLEKCEVALPPGPAEGPAIRSQVPGVATWTFNLIEVLVPRRIRQEEIGDTLELIVLRRLQGWRLYVKLATTTFWVFINSLREVSSGLLGKKRSE